MTSLLAQTRGSTPRWARSLSSAIAWCTPSKPTRRPSTRTRTCWRRCDRMWRAASRKETRSVQWLWQQGLCGGRGSADAARSPGKMSIGAGAGKFLRARKIFARISPMFLCECFLLLPHRSWTPSFGMTSKIWSSCDSGQVGRQLFKIEQRWASFLPRFSGIFVHFHWFCPDFRQIKTFGGVLALLPPTPLVSSLQDS